MSNEWLIYAAMQAEGLSVAFIILAVLAFIGGIVFFSQGLTAWNNDKPPLYKTAVKFLIVAVFCIFVSAIIPDRQTVLAMYLLPKIEAGAVNFKNVPPKMAKLIEVKIDEYINEAVSKGGED